MTFIATALFAILITLNPAHANPFAECEELSGTDRDLCVAEIQRDLALQEAREYRDLAEKAITALEDQEAETAHASKRSLGAERRAERAELRALEAEEELDLVEEDAEFMRQLREAGIEYREDAPKRQPLTERLEEPPTRRTSADREQTGIHVTHTIVGRGTDLSVVTGRQIDRALSPHQLCLHSLGAGVIKHASRNTEAHKAMLVVMKNGMVTIPNAGYGATVGPIYADLKGDGRIGAYMAISALESEFCVDADRGDVITVAYLIDSGDNHKVEVDEDGDGEADKVQYHVRYGGQKTDSVWVRYRKPTAGITRWPAVNGLKIGSM